MQLRRVIVAPLALALVARAALAAALPAPASVVAAMDAAAQYYQARNTDGDCGWTRGTYYAGSMAHYATTKNETIALLAERWAANHSYVCSDAGDAYDCNSFACGMTYAALYQRAPAPQKLALAVTMDLAIGNYVGQDWWWVDCMFMGLGSFNSFGTLLQDERLSDLAFYEYMNATHGGPAGPATQPGLWDAEARLYYRDHTFVNKTDPSGKKIFWSRGNGWAIASFAQSLKALPAGHPHAAEYAARLVAMAGALKDIQGADGMWRPSLADAALFPNPETTGSACFAFAIAFGVNTGLLDAATYAPVAAAAWAGLTSIALQPSGLVGWCQPPGGAPGSESASSTSDFCVGQFLLAGSEIFKLAGGVPPA